LGSVRSHPRPQVTRQALIGDSFLLVVQEQASSWCTTTAYHADDLPSGLVTWGWLPRHAGFLCLAESAETPPEPIDRSPSEQPL